MTHRTSRTSQTSRTQRSRRPTPQHAGSLWLLLLLCLWLAGGHYAVSPAAAQEPDDTPPADTDVGVERLAPALPIWAQEEAPPGSVALFRYRWFQPAQASSVALHIFADTRYEVWLDDAWIGRGPARFSHQRQEFDSLPVGTLNAGTHVLAVLVRYDPNLRRSESIQAGLQARLTGVVNGELETLVVTGPSWRATLSPAWNPEANEVHGWGLLGRQELLDLRELPVNWTTYTFDDTRWQNARLLPRSTYAHMSPRSIPLLSFVPRMPQAVVEAGVLSPGWQLVDLAGAPGTRTITRAVALTLPTTTTLAFEAISQPTLALTSTAHTAWHPLNMPRRPDVQTLTMTDVPSGTYGLQVAVPPDGTALALPASVQTDYAMRQGTNPGRRLLLGNPVAGGPTAPTATLPTGIQNGATITVPALLTPTVRNNMQPRYMVLDFGRTIHARVDLLAEGPPGTIIDMGWDERLLDKRPLPAPGSLHNHLWQQTDSWVLDGNPRRLTTLDTRSGRYLLLVVWGTGEVRLSQVHAREETSVSQTSGQFRSSDPLLDDIWQVGVDTLIPSLTDAYADAWRERGQWWGDAFAAFHVNRVSVGEIDVWRRGLRQIADDIRADGSLPPFAPRHNHTSDLMDYGLLWVEGLHDYWKLTGDLDLVRELLPTAHTFFDFVQTYENEHGLLFIPPEAYLATLSPDQQAAVLSLLDPERDTSQSAATLARLRASLHARDSAAGSLSRLDEPGAQGGDGSSDVDLARLVLIDWSGFLSAIGESAALNAQYSAALGLMADMMQAVGSTGSQQYTVRSAAVRDKLNERLFQPASGSYATSRFDDVLIDPTPQAQAWTLVYGVVPPQHQAAVTDALIDQMSPFISPEYNAPVVEIYGFFWVLEALGQQGRTSAALHLIRTHYGALLADGATTWWETFDSDERYTASLSHAWGGSPTWYLSRYVLGLQADEPGSWRVAPQPAGLLRASGQIPLPGGGVLAADWERPTCGAFELSIQPPARNAGTLLLPIDPANQEQATVQVNDYPVWPLPALPRYSAAWTDAGLHIVLSGAASYQVESTTPCRGIFLPLVRR